MRDEVFVSPRYELHEVLGSGGMGVVYHATDCLTRQAVALKILAVPKELLDFMSRSDSEDLRVSLAREFQFLASLRHPNIVSVLDYGFDPQGQPYLTLELLENAQTITEASAGLSVLERVQLLLQVLQALVYLHRRGIVHRDLKPNNILVVEKQVKLLDFGLAEMRDQEAPIRGTPGYLAPEILRGDRLSEAADLYSVGVVAYELFAGHPPFEAVDWDSLEQAVLTQKPDMTALAVPAALSFAIEKLLAKRTTDRYASAAEALVAFAKAVNLELQETVAIRTSFLQAAKFVGREAELSRLMTALREARNRRGSLWIVGGESGVGKTRLLEELRINAMVDGFLVLAGQANENSLPYDVWREPLRKLMLDRNISTTDVGILKLLVPDADLLLGHTGETLRQPDPTEVEGQLSAAVINLLRRQTQPMLLLLEDLHLAGHESMVLLQELEQIAPDLSLLIVGSYRDDENIPLPETLKTKNLLKLDRLSQREVAQLSEAMLGETGRQPQVQELLASETEGNVFFLVEMVRALAEQAGDLSRIGSIPLPSQVFPGGVRLAIQRRISHLPPAAIPLLRFAAVLGRQLDVRVLQTSMPLEKVEAWLLTCADAAVLQMHDGQWIFAHDKMRQGVLSDLDEVELAHLHESVAEAIELTYPGSQEFASELVFHWQLAGNHAKEYYYSMRAGERAYQLSAFQAAIRYFERAQSLLESGSVAETPFMRAEVGNYLGRIQMLLSNYSTAEQLLEESLRWAQVSGARDKQADALWSLGYNALYKGDYATATHYLNRGLELYEQDGNLYGMADALRGLARIESAQGAYNTGQARLERSLALSRESASDWHVARVLADLGGIKTMQGKYELATKDMEESLALYRKLGDRAGNINTLLYLGQLLLFQQRFDQASESFLECMSIARDIGDQRAVADSLSNLGFAKLVQGEYIEAKYYFEQAMPIFVSLGFQWGVANSLINLGHVEAALLKLDRAAANYQAALTYVRKLGAMPLLLEIVAGAARIKAKQGELLQAVELASFVSGHPATNPDIRAFSEPLLGELRATLMPEAYEQASHKGRGLSQDDVLNRCFDSAKSATD